MYEVSPLNLDSKIRGPKLAGKNWMKYKKHSD